MNQIEIGKRITKYRKIKKYTQEQLGEILGISGKSISKWERGINAPDILLLPKISEVLNVSIREILTGEKLQLFTKEMRLKYFLKISIIYIIIIVIIILFLC